MAEKIRNVIILGSGPAGLTAAIYASRGRLEPLVIAGLKYGGQLMNTTLVENWPGYAEGIQGPELMQAMVDQAKNQGAEMILKDATRVDFSGDVKKVWIGDEAYQAHAVILAVGSSPRTLGIPGENEFYGKGVSTCATCDGAFYRDKTVALVGGGDTAMEESTFLSKFAKKVYVIHRRDEFRASKAMQERVLSNDKIEVVWNTTVTEVVGSTKVEKVTLQNTQDQSESELAVDGMFLAIGHIPNTDMLKDQIDLEEDGYVQHDGTYTSQAGVFVAGELIDKRYRQAVVTAGMGCMAAMDAEKWLQEKI